MSKEKHQDEAWIRRTFDLAARGIGQVSPNPPVGAILVHEGRIIGEGFHTKFGQPHAEIEALENVKAEHRHLIPDSTLYVSLEPCCIFSKTPPCTDRIIQEGIKNVCISTMDPNPKISGKGIAKMQEAGIAVHQGILEDKGRLLIRSFTTNILSSRPYVVLKWAQSKDGFIGRYEERIHLSAQDTNVWVHKLRSETDAIMVGARTVKTDNPSLTTRLAAGRSPRRIIYDPNSTLHEGYDVFNNEGTHIMYFSVSKNDLWEKEHILTFMLPDNASEHVRVMMQTLFEHNIGNIVIEGGSYLINLFVQQELWDEAWVIETQHLLNNGVKAPNLRGEKMQRTEIGNDIILGIKNNFC